MSESFSGLGPEELGMRSNNDKTDDSYRKLPRTADELFGPLSPEERAEVTGEAHKHISDIPESGPSPLDEWLR